jgi:hypothetical protein
LGAGLQSRGKTNSELQVNAHSKIEGFRLFIPSFEYESAITADIDRPEKCVA